MVIRDPDDEADDKEQEEKAEKEKADKKKFNGKFEDIKPFIEQHLKEGGDKTTAIETAIEKFNTEKLKESRTSIVESIKNKADTGFNIAGIEGDDDRVTGDAGLQIARLKYLSTYQN
jgi:hypothetical protein